MESEGRTMGKVDRQQGWIFIDVMIGIVILSVALVGILGAYNTIPYQVNYAENYQSALSIAREQVGEVRLAKGLLSKVEKPVPLSEGKEYTLLIEPTTIDGNLQKIDVTVKWLDMNRAGQVRLTCYHCEEGK